MTLRLTDENGSHDLVGACLQLKDPALLMTLRHECLLERAFKGELQ